MTISFRDSVMDAILDKLRTNCGVTFRTYSRRFINWEQMLQQQNDAQAIPQPALFLYDGVGFGGGTDTVESRGRALPQLVTMKRTIVVYDRYPGATLSQGPDSTTPGGTIFYRLVESIEAALKPDSASEGALLLNRTVSHVVIQGGIDYVTPDIDPSGQGMMTVPIEIMLLPVLS